MASIKINNAKDLKDFLQNIDDDCPIFLGTWNGYSDTYTVADHVIKTKYENIENDFFGTRGKMDKRLFNGDFLEKDIIYIGSMFHRHIDNKDIDFPSDPNEPIELINGEKGDHFLFWRSNHFVESEDKTFWSLVKDNWFITYIPSTKKIIVDNEDGKYHFEGECIGVEDFFDITKACKINQTWRIG